VACFDDFTHLAEQASSFILAQTLSDANMRMQITLKEKGQHKNLPACLKKPYLLNYLRWLKEQIRLRRILNDLLQIINVGMTVETKMCRQQIGTRIVGDL
jgi:hypothetical protein